MNRPYIRYSAAELQALVAQSRTDKAVLSTVLAELNNRGTPSSQALKEEVRRLLGLSQDLLTPQASLGPTTSLKLSRDVPASTPEVPSEDLPPADPALDTTSTSGPAAGEARPEATERVAPSPAAANEPPTPATPTPPKPPPANLPENEALAVLKLEGPQSWNAIEEQRRKLVLEILAKRGPDRRLSEQDRSRLQSVNTAALGVFESRRNPSTSH